MREHRTLELSARLVLKSALPLVGRWSDNIGPHIENNFVISSCGSKYI